MATKKYRLKKSKSKRYRKKKNTRKQRGGCINGQCMIGGTKKRCGSEYNSNI